MKSSSRLVLIISNDQILRTEIEESLRDFFVSVHCNSFAESIQQLNDQAPWGIVADLRSVIDGGHAADRFLEGIQARFPQIPIAVITTDESPEPIHRRIVCGGLQHFQDPLDPSELAIFFSEKISGEVIPPPKNETSAEVVLSGLTRDFETNTPEMKRMLGDLEIAAKHDVTVMLIGETGSGKTFLSKLVHEASPRSDEPFLTVACGALPNDLIESELFGHCKGAFTSAHADKDGKFVAAGRGTILLDEIDVLGLEQQVKLLRVIESGEFEPVGSNQTLTSQARIIVASNLDLQPLVEQGKFRPDLYYRLNMLKFDVLPLRIRKADVVPLAVKFIEQFSRKHGIPIETIDEQLYEMLLSYPWPGNVRELENVIQRAVIYCRDGALRCHHLPVHVTAGIAGPSNQPLATGTAYPPPSPNAMRPESLQRQVAFTEQDIIEHALLRNRQSRTQTAKDLGISRVTLYNKMKKYGI